MAARIVLALTVLLGLTPAALARSIRSRLRLKTVPGSI